MNKSKLIILFSFVSASTLVFALFVFSPRPEPQVHSLDGNYRAIQTPQVHFLENLAQLTNKNRSFKTVESGVLENLFLKFLSTAPKKARNNKLLHGVNVAQNSLVGNNCSSGFKSLILVHFWATWCTPCLKDLPLLLTNYGRYLEIYQAKNNQCLPKVDLVLIALESPRRQVESFLNQYIPLKFTTLINDNKGLSYKFFEVGKLPDNLLLDANFSQYRFLNFGTFEWSVEFFTKSITQFKMATR